MARPGNGKTSVAFGLAQAFRQCIYIPYAIEVDGQIIKVYDPVVHVETKSPQPIDLNAKGASNGSKSKLLRDDTDRRWVRCRRPMIITGGELTLEMLDLAYNQSSRYHEAPIQMKACGVG